MRTLKKIGKIYNNIEEKFLLFLLAVMVIVVFYAVIRRYVFNSSLVWSDEISRFIFMWLIWFATSVGFRDNNHIRMNVLYNSLKPVGKLILDIISDILVYLASILVAYYGFDYCIRLFNNGLVAPGTHLPYFIIYGCLPVSMVIVLVRLTFITKDHILSLYRLLRYGEEVRIGHLEETDLMAESLEKESIGVTKAEPGGLEQSPPGN